MTFGTSQVSCADEISFDSYIDAEQQVSLGDITPDIMRLHRKTLIDKYQMNENGIFELIVLFNPDKVEDDLVELKITNNPSDALLFKTIRTTADNIINAMGDKGKKIFDIEFRDKNCFGAPREGTIHCLIGSISVILSSQNKSIPYHDIKAIADQIPIEAIKKIRLNEDLDR